MKPELIQQNYGLRLRFVPLFVVRDEFIHIIHILHTFKTLKTRLPSSKLCCRNDIKCQAAKERRRETKWRSFV